MNTGRILNTGVNRLSGNVRRLNLRDQLQQVVNLAGVNSINHPNHGVIQLSNDDANRLLNSFTNSELEQLSIGQFNG